MNNFEYMKTLKFEDMAIFLCDMIDHTKIPDDVRCCDVCIAQDYCYVGHKGFLDWLKEEYKE